MRILFIFLFLSLFNPAYSDNLEAEKEALHSQPELKLSTEFKQLFKREMQAIEKAMQSIVTTIAQADWQKTSQIAQQIQASYIMKQSLTAEQIQQLHHSLPAEFIELDHSFHHHAGMLAHAAESKNADAVGFYFYKLNDGCRQCHTKYALKAFPGFAENPETNHH